MAIIKRLNQASVSSASVLISDATKILCCQFFSYSIYIIIVVCYIPINMQGGFAGGGLRKQ
jgi:hypothetical protein